MFSWILQEDIYLSVLSIILKHTLFRKRDALLLCLVCSVFWVSGGTQGACGAESLLWIIIVLFIYHNGLKFNESFGHLVGPLGESTIARRDSDQQKEAVMYSSPKWVSDPESLSVWEVLDRPLSSAEILWYYWTRSSHRPGLYFRTHP